MKSMLCTFPMDPSRLLGDFQSGLAIAGGIVSFSGVVRPTNGAGHSVRTLHLQAHPTLTEQGIAEARAAALARWPLEAVLVRHRVGDMAPGDTIVFVATASAHRRAAFEAADFLMDYLKTRAVFWKKEVTDRGETWHEPRGQDHAHFARWESAEG